MIGSRRVPPIAYFCLVVLLCFSINHFSPFSSRRANLSDRFSMGQKILIPQLISEHKVEGTNAFARGEYQSAIQRFQASLTSYRNDPETLTYLNNSIARTASKKTYKLALVLPIGSNLNVSLEMLRGIAQVQTEVNGRGGINGDPLEVQIWNDENQPNYARDIAEKLSSDSDVVGVIGSNASEASLAAAPIYQKSRLVMISPTSMSDNLSGFGSYIFRTVPNTKSLAHILARQIFADGRRRLALCFHSGAPDNVSFKDQLVSEFSRLGGEITGFSCDLAAKGFEPDFSLAKIRDNAADALFLSSHIDSLELALKLARANSRRLPLYSNPSLNTFQTLEGGNDVLGLTLVTPWLNPITAASGSFSARSQRLWGSRVNWRSATSFDAGMAMAVGLKLSDGTRSGLQKALSDPNFSAAGATGPVKFQRGDRVITPTLAQIQTANGKLIFAQLHAATSVTKITTKEN